tara:strand:+ start:176 stop:454 length:279 start_codon:yes stop_codon:yes gene_type:complete
MVNYWDFLDFVDIEEYPGPEPPNWKRYDVSGVEQNGQVKWTRTFVDIGRALRRALTVAKALHVQRVRFLRPLQSPVTCSISELEAMLDYLES